MAEMLLERIRAWATARPEWQREALSRLEANGELASDDIAELVELCKAAHGLSPRQEGAQPGLGETEAAPSAVGPIVLTSLTHLGHVNALAHDQTIAFAPKGLTAVYGANAAGKSGYARILKAACRARGAGGPILTNALLKQPPGRPRALIKYSADGDPRELDWTDGGASAKELAFISVFDAHAAAVYVAERTDVAFRPLGLDLLDKLAKACEQVRKRIQQERDALQRTRPHLPVLDASTKAGKLVADLSALTKEAEIESLAYLSEAEQGRMRELQTELDAAATTDPTTRAKQLENRADRLDRLREHVEDASAVLARSVQRDVANARTRATAALLAVEEHAQASPTEPLRGVGSDDWKALWLAARHYSESHAYADHEFPPTHDGARCLLCQQTLAEDAAERLRRFAATLQSTVAVEAEEARTALREVEEGLRDLELSPTEVRDALIDLASDHGELSSALKAWLGMAAERRKALLDDAESLALPTPPEGLSVLIAVLREQATAAGALADQDMKAAAQVELSELRAREKLSEGKVEVLEHVDRLRRIAVYDQCLRDTATNSITKQSTELTRTYVTDTLAEQFQKELQQLEFSNIEIELRAAGGSMGALRHQIAFSRPSGAELPKVVSEGEARCLAVAAFMAELSTAEHKSAIIFDDPVSSLDHMWRDRVARRLAHEARVRQVIVFSHDIVFLLALLGYAADEGVPCTCRYLRRDVGGPGVCDADLPWPAMNVRARIGVLNKRMQAAAAAHRRGEASVYESFARELYGLLREAWERAVEEILLNGIVERFRKSVETQRLKSLKEISQHDITTITQAMTKCSAWIRGHDQAAAQNAPIPGPDELAADVAAFDRWVSEKRR